jgi:tetratricopeptide (TPR) repeat protein
MKTPLSCPQGHAWHINPRNDGATATCPICGAAALAAAEASSMATVPPCSLEAHFDKTDPHLSGTCNAASIAVSDGRSGSAGPPSVPGYDILAELGRGGMGVVYQARHRKLDRVVALKMILVGGHAGAAELERFRVEAQAIARLQHPNIVQVHEVGEHDGLPYLALEYCGGTLAHKLAGTPLPPNAAAELVETLARAMHYAHQRGIIHRDLKPANILLAENPKSGSQISEFAPKITDFGLAKKLDEAGQTASGAIMGTPSYMAPEQAGGKSKELGPSCDGYALGAILYECLTGRPPFKAATPMDTMLQVVNEEPVPPRHLNAKVPRDLQTVCLKCLQKEADKRYASAQALAEDLQRYRAGEPIVARPVSAVERAVKWAQRKPAQASVLVVGTIAVLVLVIGALVFTEQLSTAWAAEKDRAIELAGANAELKTTNDRLENANTSLTTTIAQLKLARADAEQKRQQAENEKQIAEGVRRFLLDDLLLQADPYAQADRVRALGGGRFATIENPTIKELLDRAAAELTAEKIEGKFPRQPLVQAEILRMVGDTYRPVGKFAEAVAHLERARALYEAELGPDHVDTLTSMNNLAGGYQDAGKLDLALPLFEETLKRRMAKLGPDDNNTLTSANNLALGYQDAGKPDLAIPLFEEVLKRRKAMFGLDHRGTLLSVSNLASAYQAAGKLDLALPLLEDTLRRVKANLGPDHPETLGSMYCLASAYRAAGKLDLALPLCKETLELRKAKLGPDHPATLASMNSVALAYYDAGKLNLALPLLEETLKLIKAKLGPDHPSTRASMNNLAAGYQLAGKLELALPLHEETLKWFKANLGPDHPDTLNSMNNLAGVFWQLKKLDRSVPLFEEVLKLKKAKLGADHPSTLKTLANLGVNYRDASRLMEAIPLLEEAHHKTRWNPSLKWIGEALLDTYVRAGKKLEAVALITEQLRDARMELPKDSTHLSNRLAADATTLFQLQAFSEAEKLLRECLAIREKTQPNNWRTFYTRSLVGAALQGQKQYADAEPLLLAGYEGMKKREAKAPRNSKVRLTETEGRLAELFDATRTKHETRLQSSLTDAKTEVVHEVMLTASKAVVIEMHSKQFNTLLRLEDAHGKLLAENDDIDFASKNTDSRIWIMPTADGVYRIVATSFQQSGRGEYEIVIRVYSERPKSPIPPHSGS